MYIEYLLGLEIATDWGMAMSGFVLLMDAQGFEGGCKHLSCSPSKEKPLVLQCKMKCTQAKSETTIKTNHHLGGGGAHL